MAGQSAKEVVLVVLPEFEATTGAASPRARALSTLAVSRDAVF